MIYSLYLPTRTANSHRKIELLLVFAVIEILYQFSMVVKYRHPFVTPCYKNVALGPS